MRILLTGPTGFLGKNLINHLRKSGFILKCFVRRGEEEPLLKNENIEFCSGDITEKASMVDSFEEVDAVIHTAAVIYGSSDLIYKTNYEGTRNLIDIAKTKKIKLFIFISTVNTLFGPFNAYARSKKMAEDYLKKANIPYVILRPTLIYGPGDNKNIAVLIKAVKKTPIIPLPGFGSQRVQPIYVGNVCEVLQEILNNPSKFVNQAINLPGPETVSLKDLVDLISQLLKVKPLKLPLPLICLKKGIWLSGKMMKTPPLKTEQLNSLVKERIVKADWLGKFKVKPISLLQGLQLTIENLFL